MDVIDWMKLFIQEVKEQPILQWIGISCGITEVLLARNNKILLYPFGIVSILISLYTLYTVGLYAETLLNIYYLVMSIYGWWFWVRRSDRPSVKVAYANRSEWKTALLIVSGGMAILYLSLKHFTDSTVPVWDAWVSATAWAGMWLLAKRKIENWIFLNVSNIFAIPLMIHKQLPLYAILTSILFLVAIQGYFHWRKLIRSEN